MDNFELDAVDLGAIELDNAALQTRAALSPIMSAVTAAIRRIQASADAILYFVLGQRHCIEGLRAI